VENAFVIITEYNRAVQGFLVHSVDRIVNLSWKEVLTPPSGTNNSNFLTAVARIDKQLVEIIDVEQIFARVVGVAETVSDDVIGEYGEAIRAADLVLVVDDSVVARKQIESTLDQMSLRSVVTKNGQEAIDTLRRWKESQPEQLERLAMVVSDIEMPTMDGYTLTSLIRQDPALKKLYVILHSSLSGVFNENMVKQVGADRFIPKFHPDDLARVVGEALARHEIHQVTDEA
jgi:two-component system chemotaxis response regulator CheV